MITHKNDKVTCGTCGRSWDDKRDPAPSALCHFCHGRGYSNAEIFTDRMRAKIHFFYVNAGYSYDAKIETRRCGRYDGAKRLADAELRMIDSDALRVTWDIDPDVLSSDWISADDERETETRGYSDPWSTWQLAVEPDHDNGTSQYLGGIDFGRDGHPDSDTYARVCVAELAAQYIAESDDRLTEDMADSAALKLVTDAAEKHANNLTCFACDRRAVLAAVKRVRQ